MQSHPIALFATLPDINLTATRVPFADANGVLTDDNGMTFTVATETFTATQIIASSDITAGSTFFVDESRSEVLIGATSPVSPFPAYAGQNNIALQVIQSAAISAQTPFSVFVLSNDQSGTDHNIGQFLFMNDALATEKRLFQMIVATDGATNAGKMTFRSFNAGSFVNGLILDKDGNAAFAANVTVTGNTTLDTSTINDTMSFGDNVNISLGDDGEGTLKSSGTNILLFGDNSTSDLIINDFQEVRIGDVSTYLQIEIDGDAFFVGSGTGWPYGHMYIDGAQTIIVALTANTPAEVKDDGTTSVDDGWLAGDLNLITFPTGGTEHHITITKPGIYHITWNLSFKMVTGAANTEVHGGLAVNGTALRDRCEAQRTISNNTDTGNMAGSCMIDLPNGTEQLSVWIENSTNNNDADVQHGSLTATQVGGT